MGFFFQRESELQMETYNSSQLVEAAPPPSATFTVSLHIENNSRFAAMHAVLLRFLRDICKTLQKVPSFAPVGLPRDTLRSTIPTSGSSDVTQSECECVKNTR